MHSVTQSCLTLVTPWTVACQALLSMGIIPARILEWVAISLSRASSQPRDQTHVSCIFYTGRQILYHWVTCTFLNLWLVFVQELVSLRGPDLCTLILCLSTRWCSGKESSCQRRRGRRQKLILGLGRSPRKWQSTPVFFPEKFHGQRSLESYSPRSCKEVDTIEWLSMHTHTHTHILLN